MWKEKCQLVWNITDVIKIKKVKLRTNDIPHNYNDDISTNRKLKWVYLRLYLVRNINYKYSKRIWKAYIAAKEWLKMNI